MKHSFTLGGLIGFALTFVSALMAGSDADTALRDAVLCSLVVAMLFRWLRASLVSHFTTLLREREEAALSAPAAAPAPSSAAPGTAATI